MFLKVYDQKIYEELNKSIDERKISIKKITYNNSLHSFELWNEKKDKIKRILILFIL